MINRIATITAYITVILWIAVTMTLIISGYIDALQSYHIMMKG